MASGSGAHARRFLARPRPRRGRGACSSLAWPDCGGARRNDVNGEAPVGNARIERSRDAPTEGSSVARRSHRTARRRLDRKVMCSPFRLGADRNEAVTRRGRRVGAVPYRATALTSGYGALARRRGPGDGGVLLHDVSAALLRGELQALRWRSLDSGSSSMDLLAVDVDERRSFSFSPLLLLLFLSRPLSLTALFLFLSGIGGGAQRKSKAGL